ncbi:unnamed protein product, partial [Adineta steineri]
MIGNDAVLEIYHYITLSHPNIIETYGLVKPNIETLNNQSILLLQEYAKDGDLSRLLTERIFIPSKSVLLEIFIQVADAMVYLSKNKIIHGDLACRNVLVVKSHPTNPKQNLVKLIDFGLTQNESIPAHVEIIYPIRYAAPEILRNYGRSGYSSKSDVYSFGVLIWEAFSPEKTMPYDFISSDDEVRQRILDGEKLRQPNNCDSEIWALMLQCWENNPEDRPDFQTIHSKLKNIQNKNTSSPQLNNNVSSLFNSNYNTDQTNTLQYIDDTQTLNYEDSYKNSSRLSLSSSSKSDDEGVLPCEFCQTQYSVLELVTHQINCSKNPQNFKRKSDRNHSQLSFESERPYLSNSNENRHTDNRPHQYACNNPISKQRSIVPNEKTSSSNTSIQKRISQSDTISLPCEICNKLIDKSQFEKHQMQCAKNDKDRIENKRRQIEAEHNPEFCNAKYSIDEFVNHQNTRRLNQSKPTSVINPGKSDSKDENPSSNSEKPSCLRDFFSLKKQHALMIQNKTDESPGLYLWLDDLDLTDEDVPEIFRAIQSRNSSKVVVTLSNNKLTAVGIKQLVETINKAKQQLELIDLSRNPIGDIGIKYIFELFGDKEFLTIDLRATELTDKGIRQLVDGILLLKPPKLSQFILGNNKGITDASVNQLLRLKGFKKEAVFDMVNCSLSEEAKVQLKNASPNFLVEID